MRKPSATSPRSRAAFTRERHFNTWRCLSKSEMAEIHGSPTSVSKIVVASVGGIVRSVKRLDSGFSIFYNTQGFIYIDH